MPLLLDRINWGCSSSPWFTELADEGQVLERARAILGVLWPFIKELPENIAHVRDRLPRQMTAASLLLAQLSDNERIYQQLFTQQFYLAGTSIEEIENCPPNQSTLLLCRTMRECCRQKSYVDGIHAIVAAEFAATMYCRASLPLYERHFNERSYEAALIASGLEWLRLHAKTHTRHAIWMKRMLSDLDDLSGNEIPESAEAILNAVLALWDCPAEEKARAGVLR